MYWEDWDTTFEELEKMYENDFNDVWPEMEHISWDEDSLFDEE